ncbi:carbohydrate ABC transporter permease [Cohnella xylanilytica]|uniref:Carbohydrate ABC transporter permease n=1 Tax=Cohnella xylanilytica TaxID=557555 RepID=A0A841U196_9BACL|nr:carbohydrate ABC transporter permease [Cohnella xylanilytica]MBB6691880.1 carbohydrate ABC transporter permease [Cohnella xylanilytica]
MGLRSRKLAAQTVRYLILIAFAVVTFLPFWNMIVVSFKPFQFAMEYPPKLIPTGLTLANYKEAWTTGSFGHYFKNSFVISIIATVGGTLVACMLAFAVSRYRFAGRGFIFAVFIGSMMIPGITFIIPQYLLLKNLHLLNSYSGLILLYVTGAVPFHMFLFKGFFDEIPKEMEEAVIVDGGNRWTFFSRVALQLSAPAIATSVIMNFNGNWGEFLGALTFMSEPEKWTLPVAIRMLQGAHATSYGLVFAASIISMLPILVLFVSFQRFIIKGIAAGAVKG